MVDFLDNLYALIKDKNALLKKLRFYSAERFILRTIANFLLPVYFKLTLKNRSYNLHDSDKKNGRVIVSLTSFPARINRIWLAIECIMRQSFKPDIIILWLSKEQFPDKFSLPKNLLKMEKRGLRIELREGDLRSHKKYYYFLQEFPDDIMVIIDDDIFYPTNMIEKLMKYHGTFPNAVIARYGLKIQIIDNEIAPYKSWGMHYQQKTPDFDVFFGSGGGTLFPAHSLPKDTLNKDLFMDLCYYADDIWLNTMCRLNNRKIFKTKKSLCSLLPVINKNSESLFSKNIGENLNDKQLRNVRDYFNSNRGFDPYKLNQNIEIS